MSLVVSFRKTNAAVKLRKMLEGMGYKTKFVKPPKPRGCVPALEIMSITKNALMELIETNKIEIEDISGA